MNRDDDCCHEGHGLRIVFGIIFGLLVFTIVISVIFGAFYYPMNGMMFPSHWFWTLFGLFSLIWFVSWIFRWPWHYRRHGYWRWDREHDTGREIRILRRRYARGEITEAEFRRMMKVLKEEDSGEEEEEETRRTAPSRRKR